MSDVRELRPVGYVYPSGARVVKNWRAWVPLDNHTPARREETVMLEEIEWPPSDDGFIGVQIEVIRGLKIFTHFNRALWIIDDGTDVRLMYTATWHPIGQNVGLKDFPAGLVGGFGPRTTYHLMITEV